MRIHILFRWPASQVFQCKIQFLKLVCFLQPNYICRQCQFDFDPFCRNSPKKRKSKPVARKSTLWGGCFLFIATGHWNYHLNCSRSHLVSPLDPADPWLFRWAGPRWPSPLASRITCSLSSFCDFLGKLSERSRQRSLGCPSQKSPCAPQRPNGCCTRHNWWW